MTEFEKRIGYTFKNPELLERALTHTSYANEAKTPTKQNERLEFLGDSILSFVVADHLYAAHKSYPEGELTRIRAGLVCEEALFVYAQEIDLGAHLRLGKGEERTGGRTRPSLCADAFEAVIAAIYLDGGFEAAKNFIMPFVKKEVLANEDYKTILQEVVQKNPGERLRYEVVEENGPAHNREFVVEVHLNSNVIGRGTGPSKKAGEQKAALEALRLMGLEK